MSEILRGDQVELRPLAPGDGSRLREILEHPMLPIAGSAAGRSTNSWPSCSRTTSTRRSSSPSRTLNDHLIRDRGHHPITIDPAADGGEQAQ